MPDSLEHLPDVEKGSSHGTFSVFIVGDVVDNTTKLVAASMPPPKAKLKIREKNISFSKVFQSLEDDFFSVLTGRKLIG